MRTFASSSLPILLTDGSKRGSRALRRVSGMISRMRETGRLEVCSWGACLEERFATGVLEALLKNSFLKRVLLGSESEVSSDLDGLDLRDACARARAPKETEDRSTLGGSSSSSDLGSISTA